MQRALIWAFLLTFGLSVGCSGSEAPIPGAKSQKEPADDGANNRRLDECGSSQADQDSENADDSAGDEEQEASLRLALLMTPNYEDDIRVLISDNCANCHGESQFLQN